jgi:3alpha(or 20beta)-hydroxysteroid dehydrogenase
MTESEPGPFRLDGRVAIITGAARGQGAAEARLFVAMGAAVVVTDLLVKEGKALAHELGDRALFVEHDVARPEDWAAVTSTAIAHFGGVDVLVNNAAVHWSRPIAEERPEEFARMLSINLTGPFLGIQSVLEPMRRRSRGSIINVSSVAGLGAFVGLSAYGSAKWGLRGLSKIAAVELGIYGIRVNTIFPGSVNTPMMAPPVVGGEDRFSRLPISRYAEPDEIAPTVLFLASDASNYLTGAEVAIDGGLSATFATTRTPVAP